MSSIKKNVLVLGGSTFMGLELLKRLCQDPQNSVSFINRGKKYWNNKVREVKNAKQIFGNRKEKEEYRKLLEYESNRLGIDGKQGSIKWSIVYDFCGFKYSEVKSAYEALKERVDLYVFISSDSVYDVCDSSVRLPGKPITEAMACRPTTLRAINQKKDGEEYAHHKLKCEEFLYTYTDKEQFPFVILRLPDVIGQYDDTGRFWAYLKWIEQSQKHPILMDKEANYQKMSLVYSEDVARLCVKLLQASNDERLSYLNQSFNISFEETITLKGLLEKLGELMGIHQVNLKNIDSASKFYPSVDCGPVDSGKAKQLLGWTPTKLDEALAKTVEFFAKAKGSFKEEESFAEKKLAKKIKTE